MNLLLCINDLRTKLLSLALVWLTLKCWSYSENSTLQGSVTDVRIRKYQNIGEYSH